MEKILNYNINKRYKNENQRSICENRIGIIKNIVSGKVQYFAASDAADTGKLAVIVLRNPDIFFQPLKIKSIRPAQGGNFSAGKWFLTIVFAFCIDVICPDFVSVYS